MNALAQTLREQRLGALEATALLRKVMDQGPPNWLYDVIIGTAPMRWFARKVYFHNRTANTGENGPQPGADA